MAFDVNEFRQRLATVAPEPEPATPAPSSWDANAFRASLATIPSTMPEPVEAEQPASTWDANVFRASLAEMPTTSTPSELMESVIRSATTQPNDVLKPSPIATQEERQDWRAKEMAKVEQLPEGIQRPPLLEAPKALATKVGGFLADIGLGTLQTFQQIGGRIDEVSQSLGISPKAGKVALEALTPIKGIAPMTGVAQQLEGTKAERGLQWVSDRAKREFQKDMEISLKEGGVPAAAAVGIGEGIWKLYATIRMAKVTGGMGKGTPMRAIDAARMTLKQRWGRKVAEGFKEAARFAGWTYTTTPGSEEDKRRSGLHAFGISLMPAVVAGVKSNALAKILAVSGNLGINVAGGTYAAADEEAQNMAKNSGKDWGKMSFADKLPYRTATMTLPLAMDLVFGVMAKSVAMKREVIEAIKADDAFRTLAIQYADSIARKPPSLPVEPRTPEAYRMAGGTAEDVAAYKLEQAREAEADRAEMLRRPKTEKQLRKEAAQDEKARREVKRLAGQGTPEDVAAYEAQRLAEETAKVDLATEIRDSLMGAPEATAPVQVRRVPVQELDAQGLLQRGAELGIDVFNMPREQAMVRILQAEQGKPITPAKRTAAAPEPEVRVSITPPKPAPRKISAQAPATAGTTPADKAPVVETAVPTQPAEAAPLQEKTGATISEKPVSQMTQPELKAEATQLGIKGSMGLAKKVEAARKTRDIAAENEAKSKAGFAAAPDVSRLSKLWDKVRPYFSQSRGLGTELWNKVRDTWRSIEAGTIEARATATALGDLRNQLGKATGDRPQVNADLADVLYGRAKPEDVIAKYGMDPASVGAQELMNLRPRIVEAQQAIGKLIEGFMGKDNALVDFLAKNPDYVTRFYEATVLGKDFVPQPEDYRAAIDKVGVDIGARLERLGTRASNMVKGQVTADDITTYLNTGNAYHLAGKLNENAMAALQQLGTDYAKVKNYVERLVADGDTVTLAKNQPIITDSAKAIVDSMLGKHGEKADRPSSPIDVSGLQKRTLEAVMRSLYGEITDPVLAAGRTMEVQSGLLANHMLMNKIFADGENVWWSATPQSGSRMTEQLGLPGDKQAQLKYGKMAGMYTTPEAKKMLTTGLEGLHFGIFSTLRAYNRLAKLYGVRTIARNYLQSYGFMAFGNADTFRPGYVKHLNDAHRLWGNLLRGKPEAMRELADMVRSGAFAEQGNSFMQDIQQAIQKGGADAVNRLMQKGGRFYSYIDLPTKIAAYRTNLDRFTKQGMVPAEAKAAAAEHVRKFYQSPESVPEFVKVMSQVPGLGDYPVYTADSLRILGNQIAYAVQSARNGDFLPMMGFGLSSALQLAAATSMTAMAGKGIRALRNAVEEEDKQITKNEDIPSEKMTGLREIVPDYYSRAVLRSWWEHRKDGTRKLVYAVGSGQMGVPAQDMILGAMQTEKAKGGGLGAILKTAGKSFIRDRFSPGMTEQALYKLATGDEFFAPFQSTRRRTTGIADLTGLSDPRFGKVMRKSLTTFGLETGLGQFGSKINQLLALADEQKKAEATGGQVASQTTPGDVAFSMLEPVRTYTVDEKRFAKMVSWRLAQTAEEMQIAKTLINKGENAAGNQVRLQEKIRKASATVASMKDLAGDWINKSEWDAILDNAGFSKEDAAVILQGREPKSYKGKPFVSPIEQKFGSK